MVAKHLPVGRRGDLRQNFQRSWDFNAHGVLRPALTMNNPAISKLLEENAIHRPPKFQLLAQTKQIKG